MPHIPREHLLSQDNLNIERHTCEDYEPGRTPMHGADQTPLRISTPLRLTTPSHNPFNPQAPQTPLHTMSYEPEPVEDTPPWTWLLL